MAATSSRVLLFAMQPLLRDILEKPLAELPGIELVTHERAGRLADAAIATRADVVIAGESAATAEDVGALLQARPLTRALAVSHDGRSGVLYELRPQRHVIGDLSVDSVLAAMTPPPPFQQQLVHESAPRSTL